ncbi:hypothetical protein F4553_003574 [Allocatelliglobosispora scoriae]|uniref:VCBS repeat-containing protein n=1 Tax=Allocatelliglobosispora scoriae TaxID=643052 RepID=A0A841BR65_9ACTN|nr:VCBS repeat-containing protein [Allocatelliglobosispora scoriae]MBB5870195.1 hypothetical protein [Allocatelliglobosispora scoriae]
MKLGRGTRLTALGVLPLLAVATAASAGGTPLPAATTTTATTAIAATTGPGPLIATAPPQRTASRPAPSTASVARAEQPAAAAQPVTRAAARFDVDGDGRDELIRGVSPRTLGVVVVVHYSRTGRDQVVTVPGYSVGHGFTTGDFNGDGIQDLAVPAQRMPAPGTFEYAIVVFDGTTGGLDTAHPHVLADLHAGRLATGDLDGDGRDELVLTDGGTDPNPSDAVRGSVTVLRGSADGPTRTGAVEIQQPVPAWPGLVDDYFGESIAVGDYTGDGYADLAVTGFRRGTGEHDRHGLVVLIPGSATGPDQAHASKIEGALDVPDSLQIDLLVMADLNQDGRDDLLLGLPRHTVGQVVYLPGSATGLAVDGWRILTQNTPGLPGNPDSDPSSDGFGSAIATGDATGDGLPDLLVGAIQQSAGSAEDAGAVFLIPGTPQGPTGAGSWRYQQRAPSSGRPDPRNPEPAEKFDYLGSAVALLDLDRTGPLEILAEAKFEDFFPTPVELNVGIFVQLELQSTGTRRGDAVPPSVALLPVRFERPADVVVPGYEFGFFGHGVVSG